MTMGGLFTISMRGPLEVRAPDGADLTPHGTKAQALIAVLAEHKGRRSRRWLEALLWSNSAPEKASGSLRQVLREIRRAFGVHRDLLQSDLLMVWLDPNRFTTDLEKPSSAGSRHCDVLEGLDVRDPEFEDWLCAFRQRHEVQVPATNIPSTVPESQILLTCTTSALATGPDALISRIIADQVGRNIGERLSFSKVASGPRPPRKEQLYGDTGPPSANIEIQCNVSREAGRGVVYLQIIHSRNGRVLFSGFRRGELGGDLLAEDLVSALAHEAAVRTLSQLPQAIGLGVGQATATGFCNLALRKLWTFEAAKVAEAEPLLRQAYDIDGNGIYLAWIAFIRMARVIERNEHPDAAFLEEVDCLLREALELAPDNAMVLALIALTRALLFNDLEAGVGMASDALQLNSGNLLARQALAVAGSARGDTVQAHRLSVFCRSAVGTDQGRHLWDLYHALICLADGRIDEAMAAAQLATVRCPNFVAPRRLLLALHAWRDDVDAVEKHLAALARLEPGFTLDAYLRDESYPVDTLRRANLLRHAASIFGR
jgi:hypothetical protein